MSISGITGVTIESSELVGEGYAVAKTVDQWGETNLALIILSDPIKLLFPVLVVDTDILPSSNGGFDFRMTTTLRLYCD